MSGPFGATPWMYDHTDFYPLDINQSLKFNDDESQYLSWTPAAAGNRKTWTWSGWVKRGNISSFQALFASHSALNDAGYMYVAFNSDGTLSFATYSAFLISTTQVFRDTSSWYHFVFSFDATQATASNRLKLYVNGVEVTSFSDDNRSSISNTNYAWNQADKHFISGRYVNGWASPIDGYLSDIHFIDGQALDATYFGEFKEGIWIPKVYNGTYGNNGFHLEFKNDDTVEGFNAVTYRGTGSTQSVSGLGLEADLLWIKKRNSAENHGLFDSIRGANGRLQSDSTDAESTTGGQLTSFDSDGFTLSSTAPNQFNQSGHTFVAWAWDAGSGSAASNTDGSITSTVKASADYGFSVLTYSPSGSSGSVGHGLGVTPSVVIVKRRDTTGQWVSHWTAISGANKQLYLSGTNAADTNNISSLTSTTFTVSGWNEVATAGGSYVAYCFAEVAGYSSFGSYSGTGATGNVVTTGFRPAFVMVKDANSATSQWVIVDATRNTSNPISKKLAPNSSVAENDSSLGSDTQNLFDFTDTGFTLTTGNGNTNLSGGNFIYMAFADTRDAAFWRDTSGNDNNWTPVNLDYRDSLPDVPTNNFAVMNQLDKNSMTLSEGNLRPTPTGDFKGVRGNFAIPLTGKWFFEARVITGGGGNITDQYIGIATDQNVLSGSSPYPQEVTYGVNYKLAGIIGRLGSNVQTGLPSFAAGDVLGVAINSTDNEVQFYKNGSTVGSAVALPSTTRESFAFFVGATSRSSVFNFGQDSTFSGATTAGGNQDDNGIGNFKYSVPSGYLALCTANLPEPTIVDGSDYFNTVLYTGNGSTQSITGVGFQPDWVWMKSRDEGTSSYTGHNVVQDSVRGVGTDTALVTNETYSEADTGYSNALTAFDSDGFSLGPRNQVNYNNDAFASWNWKAGGTAVSNTDGSITSQVSVNVDAGFSIVSYTGTGSPATIGHGLSSTPNMIMVKSRDDAFNWGVYHSGLTSADYALQLNNTIAQSNTWDYWNDDPATSSVFYVGTELGSNKSGSDYIAYCFANTDGYLKAGSYTGNGSTDGPFVYTGFRPAWIMIKRTDSVNSWFVFDNQRDPYNFNVRYLNPNSSSAEAVGTNGYNDFLSNGFKIRASGTFANASGGTYIYLAFAENPFKYSNAR